MSIKTLRYFDGSGDVQNLCLCGDNSKASNLIEWNTALRLWDGVLEQSMVTLPPPPGCNTRAMWMGNSDWTPGGEAFALRLDSSMQMGRLYSFTFTYASDGAGDNNAFSPIILTDSGVPSLGKAYNVGRLPETDGWVTNTYSFTANASQNGHNWVILKAYESSGLILSNCFINTPFIINNASPIDTTCLGDSIKLQVGEKKYYQYDWNTGSTTSSIYVAQTDIYRVDVHYHNCTSSDSLAINFKDCETRLTMPNVFTPNGIEPNEYFVPVNYNYILKGQIRIFNRWGAEVFKGDLFSGWNGQEQNNKEASTGTYYYQINYSNEKGIYYYKKGWLTLLR